METERMKTENEKFAMMGIASMIAFVVWTVLICIVDVEGIGPGGAQVGFATWNGWFHEWTGVHMGIYIATDWLGLMPVFVCVIFGGVGLWQLIKRKSLAKVDCDILILGIYYIIVIGCYLAFEMVVINYRPILIKGRMEASYPSSTTLLVMSVMPTLAEQARRRFKHAAVKKAIYAFVVCFTVGMVIGRLVSGVHWFTDIVGAALLSAGLFYFYKAAVGRFTNGIS